MKFVTPNKENPRPSSVFVPEDKVRYLHGRNYFTSSITLFQFHASYSSNSEDSDLLSFSHAQPEI